MSRLRNGHLVAVVASYFITTNAVFAASLSPVAGGIMILGCAGAFVLIWRLAISPSGAFISSPIDTRLLAACFVAVLLISLAGGALHLTYVNDDWLTRDAVLGDMSRNTLPIHYAYDGVDFLLRAPLGMYVLPALAGHLAGVMGAHVALLVQNMVLLGAAIYVFASLAPRRKYLALVLFLAFSGLDLIPQIKAVMNGTQPPLWPPRQIEWWTMYFQYSSHVTQMLWVPNHAAPGWWLAAMALLAARREYDVARLGITTAFLALWSPLAIIVAPPFLIYLAARDRFRDFARAPFWLAVIIAALFLPVIFYLLIPSGAAAASLVFLLFKPGFIPVYVMFLTIELPAAYIVFKFRDRLDPALRGLIVTAVVLLMILPLFLFGPGNDLVMRGSIAPLALLAFAFNTLLVDFDWRGKRELGVVACCFVVIGLATPLSELGKTLYYPRFAISDCTLFSAWYDIDHTYLPWNYVAPVASAPAWLVRASGDASIPFVARACWPDHPLPDEVREGSPLMKK